MGEIWKMERGSQGSQKVIIEGKEHKRKNGK
jgi:hypothetical protein